MAWSKEWKPTLAAKDTIDIDDVKRAEEVFKDQIKKLNQSTDSKLAKNDAVLHGTGIMQDGKHIPHEDIFVGIRGPLSFKDGNKLRTVQVTIIGDLALEYDDDEWEMYHVPTLSKFSKAVPGYANAEPEANCYEYDKQPLLNWMKKVQEQYPTAWTMLRCLTPENYKDNGQSAKDIIQKWCLSVKVE